MDYATSLGHDAKVDQLWLNTDEPLRVDFSEDPDDYMMAEVLDDSSAPAIAEIEIDEMLGDNPSPPHVAMRDCFGIAQGVELSDSDRDMFRDAFTYLLRRIGGVALVSGQTPEDLAVAKGFYEDTRNLGR